jgi:hypothetical protein
MIEQVFEGYQLSSIEKRSFTDRIKPAGQPHQHGAGGHPILDTSRLHDRRK